MKKILVAGARGHVGSHVMGELATRPGVVAGVSRAADADAIEASGVEARVIDYTSVDQMSEALADIDTLFLVFPFAPGMIEFADAATRAAQAAGVAHVVRSSGLGADPDSPYRVSREQAQIDAMVSSRSRAWTLVLPSFFMQNFINFAGPSLKNQGVYFAAHGDGRSAPVDLADLGRAIAAILRDPAPHAGRSYTITGGQAWSDAELVEFIAQATGKPMRYQPIEAAAAREALAAMGMPEWFIERLASLDAMVRDGAGATVSADFRGLTGSLPRTFAQFARDHRDAWV